jgi:hydroxypyruvate reductase
MILSTHLEGEARVVGQVCAGIARSVRRHSLPLTPPACLLLGGETTVTVRGSGKGGRNQELALAAAIALDGIPDVKLMSFATDGVDGPTDAAGALVDGETLSKAYRLGLEPYAALTDNDSYTFLEKVGALLHSAPTGTNVNDLVVILVG